MARPDMLGSTVIGPTNLSGKGGLLQLMNASSFIAMPRISTFETILVVISTHMILAALPWPW